MDKARDRRADRLIIGILILLTLAVYWQVWDFELVNFDDDVYIEKNPVVLAGLTSPGVRWALTANYQATWQPLVWLSLMADSEVVKWNDWIGLLDFGKQGARVYHLTNLLMHITNAILLFIVLLRLSGSRWRSAFVAALFALHPLHVESVAWVTERKDVLSGLFWMLAMLFYATYTSSSSMKHYRLALLAFALGLMSKPMLVTLPVVLLLLDYWPLKRSPYPTLDFQPSTFGPRHLFEKFPFLVLSLLASVVAFWAQKGGGAIASLDSYPLGVRLANASVAYVAYLHKMVAPVGLAVLYPHPGSGLPAWQVIVSTLGLVIGTVFSLSIARTRPYVTVGWLWYVITLLPVIGIVQFGKHAMADRFSYIPLIGIFIIIAWGVPDLIGKLINAQPGDRRVAVPSAVLGAVAVLALMIPAYVQVGYWRNSITLFSHAIKVTRGNSLAHNNLGTALLAKGDTERAIRNFRLALKYHPEYLDADYNLGNALYEHGDIPGAIRQYRKVIHIAPKHTSARNNLGSILAQQGKYDEAIEQYSAILDIDPNNEDARQNLEQARSARAEEL